jgi:hypothetical protein
MKQTAVEWLHYVSKQRELDKFDWEQAKEMEREQIEKAFDDGYAKSGITHNAQEYYEETFKSGKQSYQDKMRDKITKAKSRMI